MGAAKVDFRASARQTGVRNDFTGRGLVCPAHLDQIKPGMGEAGAGSRGRDLAFGYVEGDAMSAVRLNVKFDGERLDEGRIDVRELAPALLAIGELISQANRALHPDAPPIRVEAVATAVGSFEIDIDVVLSGWRLLRDFFTSADVDAVLKIVSTLGLVGTPVMGLIQFLRVLKGRKVASASQIEGDQVIVRFVDENGSLTSVTIPVEVLRLYQEARVQRELGKLMEVLASPEIDSITFSPKDGRRFLAAEPVVITERDRPYVVVEPLPPVLINETLNRMALSIRALAFAEGNKWRLFDGQNTIVASIEDEEFVKRVDQNLIRFAKGDVLLCEVRTVQTQSEAGLKTEHAITRVIEHIPAPTQIPITFTSPEA